jgi:hypothetical protein
MKIIFKKTLERILDNFELLLYNNNRNYKTLKERCKL